MKKRLLFINGHLNTGGVEKSLIDVLKHLNYEKYDVDLLLLEELGDYAPELPPQVQVKLCSLKNTYGAFGKCLLRCMRQRDWFSLRMRLIFLLMRLCGQKKIMLAKKLLTENRHYDCAIGFRSGICTQIAAFAVDADKRIAWWHHGQINVDRIAYEETIEAVDHVVAVSDACAGMLKEAFQTLSDKTVVVSNMLDIQTVQKKAEAFMPYERAGAIQIVTLCRLSPEKHVENAIFTAKRLKEKEIPFIWHMVGGGSIIDELKRYATDVGVTDRFIFEGNQVNPYPFLEHADLLVHPSYVESQGLVVLEAMALGVPCVVTKSLGPCEFIQNGVNGILTGQSPESLAEKVEQILTDRELYRKIKENTRCPEDFLPDKVMEKIEDLLEAAE